MPALTETAGARKRSVAEHGAPHIHSYHTPNNNDKRDWNIPISFDLCQRSASRVNSKGLDVPTRATSLFWRARGAKTAQRLFPQARHRHQRAASSHAINCSRPHSSPVFFWSFSCSFPSSSLAFPRSPASSRPCVSSRPRVTVRTRKRTSNRRQGAWVGRNDVSCKLQ